MTDTERERLRDELAAELSKLKLSMEAADYLLPWLEAKLIAVSQKSWNDGYDAGKAAYMDRTMAEQFKAARVEGAKPICLDCSKAGLINCSHFDNCEGTWVYKPSSETL